MFKQFFIVLEVINNERRLDPLFNQSRQETSDSASCRKNTWQIQRTPPPRLSPDDVYVKSSTYLVLLK